MLVFEFRCSQSHCPAVHFVFSDICDIVWIVLKSSLNNRIPASTVSSIIAEWNCLRTAETQSCGVAEWLDTSLKVAETAETSSGINISMKPVLWELHIMGFHGRAAPGGVISIWPYSV